MDDSLLIQLKEAEGLVNADRVPDAIQLLNTIVQPRDPKYAQSARNLARDQIRLQEKRIAKTVTREEYEVEGNEIEEKTRLLIDLIRRKVASGAIGSAPVGTETTASAAGSGSSPVSKPEFNLEALYGVARLQQISWLRTGLRAAHSVARVLAAGGRYGTAFHIGDGWMLTNNHVIGSMSELAAADVEFGYEQDAAGGYVPSRRYKLSTDGFWTDKVVDCTLFRIVQKSVDSVSSEWGALIVNAAADPRPGEHVSIIQHPNGSFKQIAMTENRVDSIDPPRLLYSTDTLGGSSGSPVFNDSWHVVAIHHAGGVLSTQTRRYQNEGMLFSAICEAAGASWPKLG